MQLVDTLLQFDHILEWRNPEPPHGSYRFPFHVRCSAWTELQERLAQMVPDRLIIITDAGFPAFQAEQVRRSLHRVAPCTLLTFDGGELAKTLTTVQSLGEAALEAGTTRATIFVALGGGLVGNLTGLLAGLFCRGSRFIHIPTTLLAMSDSCLSLKQGVNSSQGKNHFGLFYAPQFVWADLTFLDSLPALEIQAALGEVIKNVLGICPHFKQEIAAALRPDARYSKAQMARFIDICIQAKSFFMRNDAFEKHDAVVLEYGHSIGHALELAAPGRLTHGIAVGIGLIVEGTLAFQLGMLSREDLQTHYELLQANGAPIAIPDDPAYDTEKLLAFLVRDNKRGYLPPTPGKIDLVLLKALGQPMRTGGTVLTQVSCQAVAAAIDACRAA
jgi:3-dehydroquinate synthetase